MHAVEPARAGDRRERPQRPEGDAPAASAAAGAATPPGPTTSTTRCARCSPASATATTRTSARVAAAGQGLPPPARPRRQLLDASAAGASAPPPTTSRPSGSSSSRRTTTRSATAPSATGCRARAAAAGRVLHAAVAVHADAVHGRGVRRARRRSSSSPTTSTSAIADATREGRRREFAAFAEFARGGARPAGPGHLRALEADAPSATRSCAGSTRELLRGAPRAAAGRRRRDRVRRGRALAARAPRRRSSSPCNFADERAAACRARARRCVLATARASRGSATDTSSCPPLSGALIAMSARSGPAGRSRSGADVGRRRHELLALLRARRARRAVPVRRRRRRDAHRDDRAHRAQLALLPARRRARPALRLPRPRALRARARATASTRPSC